MPHLPTWNWQQDDWPEFRYDNAQLSGLEARFLRQSGILMGALRHVGADDRQQLTVGLLSDEALNTSEIEGEILNRDSLQSSIRRHFGLATDQRRVAPAEQGIAQMMVELHRQFAAPVSRELLFHWHELLMNGRRDLKDLGCYRTGADPMQVVSGPLHAPKVHFEAPPAEGVPREMNRFLRWFEQTSPAGPSPLPILTRAGIAHLYFVCIHPFEDGNGRLSRALAEKVIFEGLGQPMLLAVSQTLNRGRRGYYDILEQSNKRNEITAWLVYFAETVITAQAYAQDMVDFVIAKAKFYRRIQGQLNERQEKVIARMMREGPAGFEGGLSAENYLRITGTSRATATRDPQDLVEKKVLGRTGSLKSTRYHLLLALTPS